MDKFMNYSIFIKFLKYSLVLISFTILALVIYNNDSFKNNKISHEYSFKQDDFQSVKQVLHKPVFIGMDKKKQPFKVMARKATRLKESPDIFDLEKPTGELKSGTEKFFVRGDEGTFYKDIQRLKIKGNVQFNDAQNMTFNTSEMYFDFKKEVLIGNQKVRGEKNNSIIISEGFKITNNGDKIFFTGKTKLKLANEN